MSTLGWMHVIFGLAALLAGTAVIFKRKGTRWHRTLGHFYLTSMIALNLTGLFIFNLFGTFGPFHWLALASLLTLIMGMIPVFRRRPQGQWLQRHAAFMNGSYVGLVAATAAEVTSRIPGTEELFGPVVAITSFAVMAIGAYLIQRNLQKSISKTPARFNRQARTN